MNRQKILIIGEESLKMPVYVLLLLAPHTQLGWDHGTLLRIGSPVGSLAGVRQA